MPSIVNECGVTIISWSNYLFGTNVNNTFDNCYLLDYNERKQLQQNLILAHLLHLYLDQHFFCAP